MSLPEWVKDGYFNKAKELVIKPTSTALPVESIQVRIMKGKNAICTEFKIEPDVLDDYLMEFFDGYDDASYLVHLRGIYNAIKEGNVSPGDIRQKKSPAMPTEKKSDDGAV
jgi:hypothetical protein